jgi:hypothetical protein
VIENENLRSQLRRQNEETEAQRKQIEDAKVTCCWRVDGDGGIPESVDDSSRPVAEGGAEVGASGGEFVVAAADARADKLEVGEEGESGVEGSAEVNRAQA